MQNLKKIVLFSAIICLTIGFGIVASAQETSATNSTGATTQDEVLASDIGVTEPTVLPDSPFYFMKDWTRSLSLALTFDKVKKAELENKFAGERLLEIKKMTQNNADPEKIKSAAEKYRQFIGKVKENVDKIKETAETNPNVNKFLDKFTKQQVLQGKILEQLQSQVPQQVFENIKEARTQQLEKFKDVMLKLESKEKIPERLKESLKDGKIDVTNVLEKISATMPVEVKQQIQAVKEEVRIEVNAKLIENATEKNQEKNCPAVAQPTSDFCPAGIIKVERTEGGCAASFSCHRPGELIQACTMEYNPVCGKNGTTYSNKCRAKIAGVEVVNEGKCENGASCKEDSDCPQPKCAPATTATETTKCMGVVSKCVEGYCKIINKPHIQPVEPVNQGSAESILGGE